MPEDFEKQEKDYTLYIEWLQWKKERETKETSNRNDFPWPENDGEFFKIYPEALA